MNPVPPTKKKPKPERSDREAFDELLLHLDPDRDRAGEKYELLRLKLAQFFRARACRAVEDLTDEVFDRLARRIAEGEEIRNVFGYGLGIARLVWLESLKDPEAHQAPLDDLQLIQPLDEDEIDKKSRLACLDRCLRALPEADSALLVEYCSCEDVSRSAARRRIADRLQIPIGALRIRVHRIKAKFSECFDHCLTHGPKKVEIHLSF
jgi:DNA-directed RNA polymerase specialized sigma24 family protein